MIMQITLMDHVTDAVVAAFERLMPQLTRHSPPPTRVDLVAMAESDTVHVFLAQMPDQGGKIAGSATLGTFRTPTGLHGWIEDVVVDQDIPPPGHRQSPNRSLPGKSPGDGFARGQPDLPRCQLAVCGQPALPGHGLSLRRETNLYRYKLDRD
jgi:hypothetical protein